MQAILQGGVARIVAKNAVAAVPDSLDFRCQACRLAQSSARPALLGSISLMYISRTSCASFDTLGCCLQVAAAASPGRVQLSGD